MTSFTTYVTKRTAWITLLIQLSFSGVTGNFPPPPGQIFPGNLPPFRQFVPSFNCFEVPFQLNNFLVLIKHIFYIYCSLKVLAGSDGLLIASS